MVPRALLSAACPQGDQSLWLIPDVCVEGARGAPPGRSGYDPARTAALLPARDSPLVSLAPRVLPDRGSSEPAGGVFALPPPSGVRPRDSDGVGSVAASCGDTRRTQTEEYAAAVYELIASRCRWGKSG